AISHLLAKDGLVFFSTAIESAQRDHIYEFNNESQPLKMAEDVGLRVTRLVSDASSPLPGTRFLPRAGKRRTGIADQPGYTKADVFRHFQRLALVVEFINVVPLGGFDRRAEENQAVLGKKV